MKTYTAAEVAATTPEQLARLRESGPPEEYAAWIRAAADLGLTEAFRNGDTNLVSASAELVLENGVGIQLWGRNLTGEDFYTSGNALPVSNGSLAAYVNDPRTYGITVRYRY